MKLKHNTRTVLNLSLFLIIFAAFITACHDDNDRNSDPTSLQDRTLTERDFARDSNLRANPEGGVVASFLEPPTATTEENLTGELGFDVIPYRYDRTLNHRFCFLNSEETEHTLRLQTTTGEVILTSQPDGQCVTATVEPGHYEVVLNHGQHLDRVEPVFLITISDADQLANNNASGFLKLIDNIGSVFVTTAIAQTTDDNVTTLISTNSCVNCNLSGADLTGATLTFADISGADLSGASLSGVDLFECLAIGTDFSGADLSNTSGTTDLRGSDLTNANFSSANLTGVNFSSADMSDANLNNATITDAEFDNANLVGATWIDGGTCDITSVGFCNSSGGGGNDVDPCESLTVDSAHDGVTIYRCILPEVPTEICTDGTDVSTGLPVTVCEPNEDEDPITSVDLVDIFDQATQTFGAILDNNDTFAILAWGGEGGDASNDLFTSGGGGGDSGFASTVTTLSDYLDNFGQTTFYYYLGEAGILSNVDGDGGSSTLIMNVESSPSSLEDDMVLIAGGGAGGSEAGFFNDGATGGQGGIATSTVNGQGFIGVGQAIIDGAEGGSTDGTSVGGSGTNDGQDGIGGQGGQGFLGANSEWVNGDPGVGSDGRGGNTDSSFSSSGGGGGGGGLGGGGAGDGEPGAGGGSFSTAATVTCSSAPDFDNVPSGTGSKRESFNSRNGSVEIWIFPNGCN
ncbi:MAG: pentapeptide repeat-containing protein [Thermodesulfobacteriota bacterium]